MQTTLPILQRSLNALTLLTTHVESSHVGREREYQISLPVYQNAILQMAELRAAIRELSEA